jgi:hypothetical protein
MGRIVRFIMLIAVLAGIALVAYAYIGPFFGVDFTPPQTERRVPVTLGDG